MEKLAVLVANGQRPNHPKIMQILKDAEEIICVDNGYEIKVGLTSYESISVDTPEDIIKIKQIMR